MYWSVVSRLLARPVERKCYSAEQEDSLRPLFKVIVYSRSVVRKTVNNRRLNQLLFTRSAVKDFFPPVMIDEQLSNGDLDRAVHCPRRVAEVRLGLA